MQDNRFPLITCYILLYQSQFSSERKIFEAVKADEHPGMSYQIPYKRQDMLPSAIFHCPHSHCISRENCKILGGIIDNSHVSFEPGWINRDKSCNYRTSDSTAVFTNPSFPHGETDSINCKMSMVTQPTTCAVRIDFHDTNLTPAVDSACYEDSVMIIVKTQTEPNYNSPFCGYLKGYSTILQMSVTSEVQIIAVTQSYGAAWKIQLTQINCTNIVLREEDACGFHKINRRGQDKPQISKLIHRIQKYGNLYGPRTNGPSITVKGRPSNATFHDGRIFMGQEASANEYPWIAALLLDGSLHCAASLVAHQWLLTAGHCINMASSETPPIDRLTIMLGVHQFSAMEPHRIIRRLKHIYRHPSYFGVNYDIAVLQLTENVHYSAAIQPICLPTQYGAIYASANPIIAGWGLRASGTLSDVLMVTSAPLLSRRSCQAAWREKDTALADYMLCTEPRGCNGDSGGPLMAKDENELVRIIGITSFGAPMCGDSTLPDVFVKVEYFLKWITVVISH